MTVQSESKPIVFSQREIIARLERLPISAWQAKIRIIVGAATFFDDFDALAIAFILPAIIHLWKLAPAQIGLVISIGYVGQLIGALAGGWLAERIGRRPVVIVSVLWFGLLSVACALSWSFGALMAFRFLQGLGLGAEVPVAATYISELAKAKNRGRFVLLFELIFPVGILMAALLGRWIVPNLGWQYMFYVGGVPALLGLFMLRHIPESPRWLASRARLAEASDSLRFIETRVQESTGAALPPPVENTAPEIEQQSASWGDVFGGIYLSRTLVLWVCWFSTYLANYGLTIWLPSVYVQVFKLPIGQALSYGLISSALGLLASFACAMLIDRVGRKLWFAMAFLGSSASLLLLWWIGPTSAERVFVLTTISFLFLSTMSLALYLYTAELYPTRARAIGTGAATAWLRIASIIGPIVVGFFVGRGGLSAVFLLFGLACLIAFAVVTLFGRETGERVLEEISP
jgi:putative MFS transporter